MTGYSRSPAECGFNFDYLKSFARGRLFLAGSHALEEQQAEG